MSTNKFCSECGEVLVYSERPCGFDNDTGEQLYEAYWKCPNRGGLMQVLFGCDTHARFRRRPGGSWQDDRFYVTSGLS